MQETQVIWVGSLHQEDPLESETATHSIAKRESHRILLPGESHGQRSLAGYSPWDPKELDMAK